MCFSQTGFGVECWPPMNQSGPSRSQWGSMALQEDRRKAREGAINLAQPGKIASSRLTWGVEVVQKEG